MKCAITPVHYLQTWALISELKGKTYVNQSQMQIISLKKSDNTRWPLITIYFLTCQNNLSIKFFLSVLINYSKKAESNCKLQFCRSHQICLIKMYWVWFQWLNFEIEMFEVFQNVKGICFYNTVSFLLEGWTSNQIFKKGGLTGPQLLEGCC